MEDGIQGIDCREGSQQGCNLGNLLCGMSFQPFVEGISQIVKHEEDRAAFAKFFVDDGNILSSPALMWPAFGYMIENGPIYGYHMNLSKSVYLIGVRNSYEEAISTKIELTEKFGFNPDNFHIDPDNYLHQDIDQCCMNELR